jgi:hypothetical protein
MIFLETYESDVLKVTAVNVTNTSYTSIFHAHIPSDDASSPSLHQKPTASKQSCTTMHCMATQRTTKQLDHSSFIVHQNCLAWAPSNGRLSTESSCRHHNVELLVIVTVAKFGARVGESYAS